MHCLCTPCIYKWLSLIKSVWVYTLSLRFQLFNNSLTFHIHDLSWLLEFILTFLCLCFKSACCFLLRKSPEHFVLFCVSFVVWTMEDQSSKIYSPQICCDFSNISWFIYFQMHNTVKLYIIVRGERKITLWMGTETWGLRCQVPDTLFV